MARRLTSTAWVLLVTACSSEPAAPGGGSPLDASLVDVGAGGATNDAGVDGTPLTGGSGGTPFIGPVKLSETGLYSDIATRNLSADVRAFDVRYPLWSDGSSKQRYLYLPPGETIDTSYMDVWKFPIGTKAWKEFSVGGQLVETRMLWKQSEGPEGWLKVAYLWDENGDDATAVPDGVVDAMGTMHDVPAVTTCEQCHEGAGDVLVGVSAIQLSKENGGGYVSTLIADAVLSNPPSSEFKVPGDGVVEDAIGYLHGNCGQCHNDQSWLATNHVLRLKLVVSATLPEETPLYQSAINTPMAHVLGGALLAVVPGEPDQSQLRYRMSVRDRVAMPPVGTEVVDDVGLQSVTSWIDGLAP